MTMQKFTIRALLMALVVALPARSADDAPPKLTEQEIEACWKELAGFDPDGKATQAYKSVCTLAASPQQTIELFKTRIKPIPKVDGDRIKQLIADLDSNNFAVRQKAETELERLNELAELAMKEAMEAKPPLEVKQRIEKLLAKLEGAIGAGEKLRTWRAIETLEMIGTAEALDVLKMIAGGAREARVTQEAQTAVERLSRRVATAPAKE